MTLEEKKAYMLAEHDLPRRKPYLTGLDDLHFDTQRLDGPQKPFRCAVSEREPGKSTAVWLKMYRENYETNCTVITVKRLIKDITRTYIEDIEKLLNKFTVVPVELEYSKGSLTDGIIDVYISEISKTGAKTSAKFNRRLFFRIIGLSNPLSRIKSMMMPNLKYGVFDEFICNTRCKEKYLKDERFAFEEMYNTFNRETKSGIVFYFLGNPYSAFNPYFQWWGVDTKKIKPGAYLQGGQWTVECYQMKQELKDAILKKNPLYQFDEDYKKYAFDGTAINDANIRLASKPEGSILKYVFKLNGLYYGYWLVPTESRQYKEDDIRYYCERLKWDEEYARTAICFDFGDMNANTNMLMQHSDDVYRFLKTCIANGRVGYDRVDSETATEEVFENL